MFGLTRRLGRTAAAGLWAGSAILLIWLWSARNPVSHSGLALAEAEIRRLDEVLTMSARMYAATGDAKWKERYEGNVGALDEAISQARRLSLSLLGEDLVLHTDDANKALVDMETRSFALVESNHRDEATQLLESSRYECAKMEYWEGMAGLWDRLKAVPADQLRMHRIQMAGCTLFVLLAPLAGWLMGRARSRRAPPTEPELALAGDRRSWPWRSIAWSAVTLVFCLSLTSMAIMRRMSALDTARRAEFNRLADLATAEVQRRAAAPIFGLEGMRGTFATGRFIDEHRFSAHFSQHDIAAEFPGTTEFGFAARTERFAAGSIDHSNRGDTKTESLIQRSDEDAESFVVRFVAPAKANQNHIGRDLGVDPECRLAIERAVREARPAATARIALAGENGAAPGIRYFMPVYKNAVAPDSPEQREQELDGVLFATLSLDRLMPDLDGLVDGMITMDIFDGRQLAEPTRLTTARSGPLAPDGRLESEYERQEFYKLGRITNCGKEWSLAITSTPRFARAGTDLALFEEALGGVLISFLLAGFVFIQGSGRSRALRYARAMTSDLAAAKSRAEAALRQFEALRMTVSQTAQISITDSTGVIVDVNDLFCRTSGYAREELIGQYHRIVNSGVHSRQFWQQVWEKISSGHYWRGDVCNRAKDGSHFWVDTIIAPFCNHEGQIERYVAIRTDITARKLAEDHLRVAALTDRLTGLPNRAMLTDRLQIAFDRHKSYGTHHFGVLFLDFDRFKLINDNFGHDTGDAFLGQIAERLASEVRAFSSHSNPDGGLVARFGGDEFIILLEDLERPEDALRLAARLTERLAGFYELGEHRVHSSASIGVTTSAVPAASVEEVLRDADVALYEAKSSGKACYAVFDSAMHERVRSRHELEIGLRSALERGDIRVAFQPIVQLDTGQLVSFEALARWTHPKFGPISPAKFIDIAEETGLIARLGRDVLAESCRQLARMRRLPGGDALSMNVNVSRRQLSLPGFAADVQTLIREYGIPPVRLRLEITESTVMANQKAVEESLRGLKAIGVQLYMDDFGTGLSSLGLLRRLPLDGIKIDRSFIDAADGDREAIAVLHAIIHLGHNLGMSVTVEGIEKPEQVAAVLGLDCDFGQGHLFGRASTPDEADRILHSSFGAYSAEMQESH